ncbi:MAG: hypothetical protein JWP44_4037 [Mucilaginibacter sp.]|nr:hypothetical protein [Mucilaginibacter sp.]
MKLLFTAITILFASFSFAQRHNVYFLKNNGKYVDVRDSADYIRMVSEPDTGSVLYNVAEYYLNGNRKLIGKSSKIDPPRYEGQCASFYKNGTRSRLDNYKDGLNIGDEYEFYPSGKLYLVREYPDNNNLYNDLNGNYLIKTEYDSVGTVMVEDGNGHCKEYDAEFKNIIEEGNLKSGKRDGVWKGYFKNVQTNFTENYKNGILIDGTATFADGKTGLYTKFRGSSPQFKSGLDAFYRYLGNQINYPTEERKKNIQGVVAITFVVEKNGKIADIKVVKSVSPGIDNEAVRVIENSPTWVPGTMFGQTARVVYSVPINFALTN